MSKNKSHVKIEHPQGSETHALKEGEEITVKTTQEKPTVSGGGGFPFPIDTLGDWEFAVAAFFALWIALILIVYTIIGAKYVIETYVIKGVVPSYQTSFEKEAEWEKKKKEIFISFDKDYGFFESECSIGNPWNISVFNKKIVATIRMDQTTCALLKSEDYGESWVIIWRGKGRRCYFCYPKINSADEIQFFLNWPYPGINDEDCVTAISKDNGHTWKFYSKHGNMINPSIKDGDIIMCN